MKSKLKIFSLILLILISFLTIENFSYKKVLSNHVDYILVTELDNNLIYENKPLLNEENFKREASEKIERFFVERHIKLENIDYQIDALSIKVKVHYSIFKIPNYLLKEVGVYEKP